MHESTTMGTFINTYTERIVNDYTRLAHPKYWKEEAIAITGVAHCLDLFLEGIAYGEDAISGMHAKREEASSVLASTGDSTSELEYRKKFEKALDFLAELHALICGVRQESRRSFYRMQIYEDDRPHAILKAKCLSMAAFHKQITPQEIISMATAELELAERVNKINSVSTELVSTFEKSWPSAKVDIMLEALDSGAVIAELYAMYNQLYIESYPKGSENVIPSVEALMNDMDKAWRTLRKMLSSNFGYPGSVILISMSEMVARRIENERAMHAPLGSSVIRANGIEKMNLQCMF